VRELNAPWKNAGRGEEGRTGHGNPVSTLVR
jgi:hypothetical protein